MNSDKFWLYLWLGLALIISGAISACWWANAYKNAAAFSAGYEQRAVITKNMSEYHTDTVWVKQGSPVLENERKIEK